MGWGHKTDLAPKLLSRLSQHAQLVARHILLPAMGPGTRNIGTTGSKRGQSCQQWGLRWRWTETGGQPVVKWLRALLLPHCGHHNQQVDYSATFLEGAGSFPVSAIHRTLAWTTGSLTRVRDRDHSDACVYYTHGGWAHRQQIST